MPATKSPTGVPVLSDGSRQAAFGHNAIHHLWEGGYLLRQHGGGQDPRCLGCTA